MKYLFALSLSFWLFITQCFAQPVPGDDENIPYLMTFGPQAETSWGDDDYSQTFFFLVPKEFNQSIYIRVFDPDCGGQIDEKNGEFDSRMTFGVYGGKLAYTHKDAQETDPVGNYKSGNLLATKSFGVNEKYDNQWYSFGPYNPTEGEYVEKFDAYIFKVVLDGVAGDDGNLYKYFMSTSGTENRSIEGAYAFAYEYSFRMHDNPNEVSHIYPYVDDETIAVKQSNFDWDSDGHIRIISVARNNEFSKVSEDDNWAESEFIVKEEEKKTSLDIQFIKSRSPVVRNNNVVVNVRNQRGDLLRFNTLPIGGVPKYKYSISVKPQ